MSGDLDADVVVAVIGKEMVDDREVALRLVLAVTAYALVDGREVVEHLIGTVDGALEMTEYVAGFIFPDPERGNVVAGLLDREDGVAEGCCEIVDDGMVDILSQRQEALN